MSARKKNYGGNFLNLHYSQATSSTNASLTFPLPVSRAEALACDSSVRSRSVFPPKTLVRARWHRGTKFCNSCGLFTDLLRCKFSLIVTVFELFSGYILTNSFYIYLVVTIILL